jgi:hypothetical protein
MLIESLQLFLFVIITAAYLSIARGFRYSRWKARIAKFAGLGAVVPVVMADSKERKPYDMCGMRPHMGQLKF